LAVMAVYLLLVSMGAAVRLAFHYYGIILSPHGAVSLFHVLVFHGVGVLVVWTLLAFSRRAKVVRPIFARLGLAGIPFLLLISLDLFVAVYYRPVPDVVSLFDVHPSREWTMRPGWRGVYVSGKDVRLNSLGFRGAELPLRRATDEQRVLFLGDSVTFGYRVSEEVTFVTRLQDILNEHSGRRRVTTINASAIGYSPWQEYDLLIDEGLRSSPDLIVHLFCLNDVLDQLRLERFGGVTQGYRPPGRSILDWSGLYRAALVRKTKSRESKDKGIWSPRAEYAVEQLLREPSTELVRRGWAITLESMKKTVDAARTASVPLVLICTPCGEQLEPGNPYSPIPQAKLTAFAKSEGILFFDLLPVFRQYLDRHGHHYSVLLLDTLHFTPLGHEVAADAISEFLVKNGLIK